MNIGWIGLGKLGLPCALVLAQHHQVTGYDISGHPWDILSGTAEPMREEGIGELLASDYSLDRASGVPEVVKHSDVIFVAVQTPHGPEYGGEQPMPPFNQKSDFEYQFLVQACRDVCEAAWAQRREVTLVVVSTVLPGTMNRLIRPMLNKWVHLVYSPQFIAMGTTIRDFTEPEFVICGSDDESGVFILGKVFAPVHGEWKLFSCDITTAEAIKVFYNTFISMKIVWANHVMELCHKIGADCDLVSGALAQATDRIISGRYMRGGMGDGGACHPRDLIALSWLEHQLEASTEFFGDLARAREFQARWLARLAKHYRSMLGGVPIAILGESYKPGSDLTAGSPALLLEHYLRDAEPKVRDPHTGRCDATEGCRVFVIGTMHEEWRSYQFPLGSVVIDPFGYIEDQDGVWVVRVGRK